MIQFNYFTILHSGILSKIVLLFADFFFFLQIGGPLYMCAAGGLCLSVIPHFTVILVTCCQLS